MRPWEYGNMGIVVLLEPAEIDPSGRLEMLRPLVSG